MLAIIFAHLYALVPVLSIIAYTPQILTLVRSPGPANDICLRSWLIWAISGLVTLGYGAYCLHDQAFCVVTLLSLLPMLMILGIVVYKRHVRMEKPGTMQTAPIRVRTDP